MAGGMGRGRSGIPLGERRRAAAPGVPEAIEPFTSRRNAMCRHVWLVDAPGQPGRWPGLLVEWRRATDGSWDARVVYAVPEPSGLGNRVLERWLPGGCLLPVTEA